MAAPVFYISPDDEPDARGVLRLTGSEARHASQVSRLRSGEAIDLVDGAGRRFAGEVMSVARESVDVRVITVDIEPVPSPRIVVVQALVKGDRGELAVEMMTEVGVDIIVPWSAEHCVTRWVGERAEKGVAKWRSTARAAAKQARRSRIPDVLDLHATRELEGIIAGSTLAISLDESAAGSLSTVPIPDSGDLTLIVGPEGGLSDPERGRLLDLGVVPALLGPTVLRTSTAGPVGAAVVLARTSRWGCPR